jgi:hypothetical protein
MTRSQRHPSGKLGQLPIEYIRLYRNPNTRRSLMPAQLINGMAQTFSALAFPLEFFPLGKAPQMFDQKAPVDQKGPASLVTVEAMQQFDRTTAPQAEQVFDDGAVHHRHVERFSHRDDFRNVQQPQGFGGHRTDLSPMIMLLHTCAAEVFF